MTPSQSVATNLCLCGCGEVVKPDRKFRRGHDQKLRLKIEESVGGLESLKALVEKHLGRKI